MYDGVSSHCDVFVDRHVWMNAHPFANERIAADDDAGADAHAWSNPRRWIDYGCRMNGRLEFCFGMEDSQRARVSEIWILYTQYRDLSFRFRVFAEVDSRGARGVDSRRVTRVGQERDVSFAGFVEAGSAGDLDVVWSLNPCACQFR